MGRMIEIKSADGFSFGAWHAEPAGPRKGGVIVIQEIFGVNGDIRRIANDFAELGYEALAPSMFDRLQKGFASEDHSPDAIKAAIPLAMQNKMENALADVAASIAMLAPRGPVFITGFCYGGSISYLAACKLKGLAATSSYYGSQVPGMKDLAPLCPVIAHFGAEDGFIPLDGVNAFAAARKDVPVHIYPAGHGFGGFGPGRDEKSAALALERTLTLFTANS